MNDLISRADIVEKLRKNKMIFCKNRVEYFALSKDEKARVDEISNCIAEILNMPSVEPERKKGEWVIHFDDLFPEESTQECSICHEEESLKIHNDNFCPNCGAEMFKR